jgi:hypothetical protein
VSAGGAAGAKGAVKEPLPTREQLLAAAAASTAQKLAGARALLGGAPSKGGPHRGAGGDVSVPLPVDWEAMGGAVKSPPMFARSSQPHSPSSSPSLVVADPLAVLGSALRRLLRQSSEAQANSELAKSMGAPSLRPSPSPLIVLESGIFVPLAVAVSTCSQFYFFFTFFFFSYELLLLFFCSSDQIHFIYSMRVLHRHFACGRRPSRSGRPHPRRGRPRALVLGFAPPSHRWRGLPGGAQGMRRAGEVGRLRGGACGGPLRSGGAAPEPARGRRRRRAKRGADRGFG